MSELYFPFNATSLASADRSYNAESVSAFDRAMYTDGIVADEDQLAVTAGTGMQSILGVGFARVYGKQYANTAPITFTHDPADGALDRIDRIVIRKSLTDRSVKAFLVKGTAGASPVAPALTRNADVYEIARADITIAAGVTSITLDDIHDNMLDDDLCGITTARIDITSFLAKLEADLAAVIAGGIPGHADTMHEYGGTDVIDPTKIGQHGVAQLGADGKVSIDYTKLGYQTKSGNYTLAAGDENIMTKFTATASVTIPANVFPVGTIIPLSVDSGTLTVVAGSGVTLKKVGGYASAAATAAVALEHLTGVGTEDWLVVGCSS